MNANRIGELRKAKGIDPTEFAFRIRRTANTVWRYENSKAVPSLATAQRIADVLECTVDDLFPEPIEREVAA